MVYCNQTSECQGKFGNEITQCSEIHSWLAYGVCTPKNCQNHDDCPIIGDKCTSGVLKCYDGYCDTATNQCKYSSSTIDIAITCVFDDGPPIETSKTVF